MQDLTEDLKELRESCPTTLSLQESAPVSCKGKKDWLGRPYLWHDEAQECRPVKRRLLKKMHAAQKASADAIGHSQKTVLGQHSHEDAGKSNESARKAHEDAAKEFHRAGFASAGNAHLKQAVLHHKLHEKHLSKRVKGDEPKEEKKEAPPSGASSSGATPLSKRDGFDRDHRGRFARKV